MLGVICIICLSNVFFIKVRSTVNRICSVNIILDIQEKEELVQDVESKLSVINSLQAQLQIVEEKLEKSEVILLDHEKFVVEERKKAEQMEAEMHVSSSSFHV